MRRAPRVVVGAIGAVLLVVLGGTAAAAETGPGLTVVPASGLRDGDVLRLTATGFFNLTYPLDSSPGAYQCRAGILPTSATGPLESAPILSDLLRRNCVYLGRFPVGGVASNPAPPTSLDVVVRETVTLGDGTQLRCGGGAGSCVMAAAGLTPPSNVGVATAPITFATTPK